MRNSVKGRSACGLPLRDGVRIVIMDLNTYPDYQAHRAIAASRGYRGVSIDAPLDRNIGKSVGDAIFGSQTLSASELLLSDLYARQAADMITFRLGERRLRESAVRLQAAVNLVN